MADTFYNIYLHIVSAVKYRDAMLKAEWREELYSFMAGIIKNLGHMPIMIGGHVDHVHILMSTGKVIDLPSFVKSLKLASNQWIQPKYRCKFQWQPGYGCFSVSNSHVQAVSDYIKNQEIHHSNVKMIDEFRRLMHRNGINYEEQHFFKEPE